MENINNAFNVGVNVKIQQFDAQTGELLDSQEVHNLVVNGGLQYIVECLVSQNTEPGLELFAIGDDSTPVDPTDVSLGNPLLADVITNFDNTDVTATIEYYLGTAALNGETLSEAALIGKVPWVDENYLRMFARVVYAPVNKTVAINVLFSWQITLSAV